jgi:hypothetical protein
LPADTKLPANVGASDDDDILSVEFGGKTIGDRLEAAIAAGAVARRPDGKLELSNVPQNPLALDNGGNFEPDCLFLNDFMFAVVYGQKAVPIGCRDCYKVKVTPSTLRQLVAVKDISDDFACLAKSRAEVDSEENQSLYATYFYLLGLDKARAVYRRLRGKIDADPRLGPSVKMVIKRGCTNYERACGPSDRYTFDSRQEHIERYFQARFVRSSAATRHARKYLDAMNLLNMVRTAYRIGDDTYKDFTAGRDLFPPTVIYDPEEPSASDGDLASEQEASVAGRHFISR